MGYVIASLLATGLLNWLFPGFWAALFWGSKRKKRRRRR